MFYRFGRGSGRGRGMGFGFRGGSPPWPYIGRGRGGLPRCGYFAGADPGAAWSYGPPYGVEGEPVAPAYGPPSSPMTKEEELAALQAEAEAIKEHLEALQIRMRHIQDEE